MLPDHEAIQWEEWLVKVDQALEDRELLDLVQEALAQRYPRSKNRGRPGTPAEMALRLLLLKHLKNWSCAVLGREVRANLVYRQFTRVGTERVPDEKTMVRLGQALGPVTKQLHERVVALAVTKKVVRGRKLRLDTTVTEKNIRYPTDSQLLGDGMRVITWTIEKLKTVAGETQLKFRNRARSVNRRLLEISRAALQQGEAGKEKLQRSYGKLLLTAQRVVGAGERTAQQLATKVKRMRNPKQKARAAALRQQTAETIALVRRVMSQTKARVFGRSAATTTIPTKCSASLSQTAKRSAKGKPPSLRSLASWSRFKKRKTRSLWTTKSTLSGRPTPPCCCQRSANTKQCLATRHDCWQPTPLSSARRMKPPPRRRE